MNESIIKVPYKLDHTRPEFNNRYGVRFYLKLPSETRSGLREAVRLSMEMAETIDKSHFKAAVIDLLEANKVDMQSLYNEVAEAGYEQPKLGLKLILEIIMMEFGHHLKYQRLMRGDI